MVEIMIAVFGVVLALGLMTWLSFPGLGPKPDKSKDVRDTSGLGGGSGRMWHNE